MLLTNTRTEYWKHEQTTGFEALFTVCLQRERKRLIFTPVSPPPRPRSRRIRTRKRSSTHNQKPASERGWHFVTLGSLQHGSRDSSTAEVTFRPIFASCDVLKYGGSNVSRHFCYFTRAGRFLNLASGRTSSDTRDRTFLFCYLCIY